MWPTTLQMRGTCVTSRAACELRALLTQLPSICGAQAAEVWAAVRSSAAAQKIVARELEHALNAASTALPEAAVSYLSS